MQKKLPCLAALLLILLSGYVNAQSFHSIPASTAYALPAEESNENGDSKMFSPKNGLQNWTNPLQQVQFFFKIRTKGTLLLSMYLKNDVAGNKLSASFAGKKFSIAVPASKKFVLVKMGSVEIADTGFYALTLSSLVKKGTTIADIRSLEVSGTAANNIHFNPVDRRNAASVHLFYPLEDSMKAVSFYNEITIPKDADPLHSYYMACGFARGYFGIQVNSPTERRVIFSVWDAGNEATDRNKVDPANKVQLLAKGEDVFADGFGNEGTGGHSHWVYDWKPEVTYRFVVTAATDSATATTSYAGYFFVPEIQKWKLIACFKAPKDGKPLRKLYSFVENFEGNNGQLIRTAWFGNQWIRRETGEWKELTTATFSYDATGKAGHRIDYGAGVNENRFYLWNGGYRQNTASFGDTLRRKAVAVRPVIDFYKNADSTIEVNKEREEILKAIQAGQLDTTGSSNGVYYKIIKEGNGDMVALNDTLVVHYKGMLMNGFVFDQTTEKPATFPLKRLIKGWQNGMVFCRQGGKIRLIIPSYLGYSIRNLGEIPPNNILIFEVEVVEIKKGKP